jgi:hypothetical protein
VRIASSVDRRLAFTDDSSTFTIEPACAAAIDRASR